MCGSDPFQSLLGAKSILPSVAQREATKKQQVALRAQSQEEVAGMLFSSSPPWSKKPNRTSSGYL